MAFLLFKNTKLYLKSKRIWIADDRKKLETFMKYLVVLRDVLFYLASPVNSKEGSGICIT